MKTPYIAYAISWLSVSLAVCVGIYYTHSIKCLWFLLIPTLINVKVSDNNNDKSDKDNDEEEENEQQIS